MFKDLGKLIYQSDVSSEKIKISDILEGSNNFNDYIIYKNKTKFKVYNRICDHAGGKIISRSGENICPVHKWKFNSKTGFYTNGIKKKESNYFINKKFLEIEKIKLKPQIKINKKKDNKVSVRFFNHAFLHVQSKKYSFSIDPWAIGPAFNTGWWLKHKTKEDWIKILNNSNFIYISHNHPDHLHPLTLSKIDKTIPIVVPKFITDSTGKYIESLGFKNIIRLEFEKQYNLIGSDLIISILKSGDFREDSGIYFSDGNFTSLFDVDSNAINFERLPEVDLYASSFAGGASGYPIMFDNYNHSDQIKIMKKEKNFLKWKKVNHLKKMKTNYFLPYAGFFEENLERDSRVKKYNQKNSINDYETFCNKNNIKLLNVENKDLYKFNGNKLLSSNNVKKKNYMDLRNNTYLNYYKKEYSMIDEKYIKDYFINSRFTDPLKLYIILTDDNFISSKKGYSIDFSKKKITFKQLKIFNTTKLIKKSNNKILILKVRKESFKYFV